MHLQIEDRGHMHLQIEDRGHMHVIDRGQRTHARWMCPLSSIYHMQVSSILYLQMQVSSILYLATHACIEDTYIPDFLFKSHYSRSLPLKSGIYVSSIDLYSYGDISNVRMLLYTCPHTATYAPAGVVSRGLHRCKRGAGWVAACAR